MTTPNQQPIEHTEGENTMAIRTSRRTHWLRETFPIQDASEDFIRDGGLGIDEMVTTLLRQANRHGNKVDLSSLKVTVQAEPLRNDRGPLVLAVHAHVDAQTYYH